MPVVHPAELWRESGRYDDIGPEMARFKDRGDRDMVLAMTHEEVVADLLRDLVRSYRQLPMIVYHFQTKFRDEPRARGGPDPRARVRDEGLLHARPRLGGPRRELPEALRGLLADLRAARPRRHRRQLRRRDDGRHRGPRVHGPQPVRRGHAGPLRGMRLRGEPADRARRSQPGIAAEDGAPARGGRDPDTTTIEALATFLGHPRSRARRRRRSSSRATGGSSSRSSAATTTSTRRSSSTRSRRSAGCVRRRSRRSRRAGCSPATGRRSGRATRSSWSTTCVAPLAEPRRRGEQARLAPAEHERARATTRRT